MKIANLMILVMCVGVIACASLPRNYTVESYLNNPAIQRFREYVMIDTSKEDNLEVAVKFWQRQAAALGLVFAVHRPAGKPVCVLSWPGSQPLLPSIMLNSHMDVVVAEPDRWTYPPFSAHIDENGDIYGRGTQDDKDVAIQYLEAIRKLKESNVTLQRTLHITLMPDEETGGFKGMVAFVETPEFAALNIGFALDEGLTSTTDTVYFTYKDKRPWQCNITVSGESGHSSGIPDNSAAEKLLAVMDAINHYREEQKIVLNRNSSDFGAYDSVNINEVQGGIATNVIPGEMSLVADIRWADDRNVTYMQNLVNSWVALGGNGTTIQYIRCLETTEGTPLDNSNIYWTAIKEAAGEMNLPIATSMCPAVSDMINLRSRGIPALGFSPKTHTTSHIHGNDEYLNAATFLRGIDIYVNILKKLGNLCG